jgi:hypothetical protein
VQRLRCLSDGWNATALAKTLTLFTLARFLRRLCAAMSALGQDAWPSVGLSRSAHDGESRRSSARPLNREPPCQPTPPSRPSSASHLDQALDIARSMALITVSGFPSAGKTRFAERLTVSFEERLRDPAYGGPALELVRIEDDLGHLGREAYSGAPASCFSP